MLMIAKILGLVGVISGVLGIIFCALTQNWLAVIWAVCATGWALNYLVVVGDID